MRLSNLPIALIIMALCLHCAKNYHTQDFLDGKFLGDPATYKKYPPLLLTPQTTTLSLSQSVALTASGGAGGYSYAVISGKGSVTQAGVYTASDIPGAVVIEVKDSVGTNGHATVAVNVDQKLPNTASGMKLWIKADVQPFSNGNSVFGGTMVDSSGFGAIFTAITSNAKFATNAYNGKPVFRHNGSGDQSPTSGAGFSFNTTTNTIIVVATTSSTSSGNIFISSGTSATPILHANPFYWDNQTAIANVNDLITMDVALANSLNVLVITQTDSTLLQTFQNGILAGEKVPVSPLNGKNITYFGGNGNPYFGGDVAEIILYNRVLTNAENYAIQCGLAKKWGFTMANCQ